MFKMYDLNMQEIPFPVGFRPLDIFISSIEKDRKTDRLEDSSYHIDYGAVRVERDVELKFSLRPADTKDYRLLRDAAYRLFDAPFYLVETYQPGKRYRAVMDSRFIPDRLKGNQRYADGEVKCFLIPLPYAESIGTSMDIHRDGITSEKGLWGFGMGLIADDDSLNYIHTGTSFRVYNAGDVEIHPFEHDIKVTVDQVIGSTVNFELANLTTGDVLRVTEPLTGTLLLDRDVVTINGAAAFRKTNRQFITLAPGWNEFKVSGATSARVTIDTRFYYL